MGWLYTLFWSVVTCIWLSQPADTKTLGIDTLALTLHIYNWYFMLKLWIDTLTPLRFGIFEVWHFAPLCHLGTCPKKGLNLCLLLTSLYFTLLCWRFKNWHFDAIQVWHLLHFPPLCHLGMCPKKGLNLLLTSPASRRRTADLLMSLPWNAHILKQTVWYTYCTTSLVL